MKTQYGISKGQRINELKGRTIEMNQSEEYRENRPGKKKGNKLLGTCDAVTKDFKVVLMNLRRRRKRGRLKTFQIWQKTF